MARSRIAIATAEFEEPPKNRTEILDLWDGGWKSLFTALEALSDADLTKTVKIRGEEHSVMQAINRQIAHYCYLRRANRISGKTFCGGELETTYGAEKQIEGIQRRRSRRQEIAAIAYPNEK